MSRTDAPVEAAVAEMEQVLLGKSRQIRLALCCLLSRGHLLLEDLPGMGKTTLAHALADVLGLSYRRIQFTADLLPSDILGVSILDPQQQCFVFQAGPIFTEVLLADEINRSSPRTQSALLEAMGERQVSVDGATRPLPDPFFVIATQNPTTQHGTYPLPESQLDRFAMRLQLGFPDAQAERELLRRQGGAQAFRCTARITPEQRAELYRSASQAQVSDTLLDYVQRLLDYTRGSGEFGHGLSPRAALILLGCARTWAVMQGRQHVLPEDIQAVFPAVASHRLGGSSEESLPELAMQRLLEHVDVLP